MVSSAAKRAKPSSAGAMPGDALSDVKDSDDADVPFILRFRAWWEGCTVEQMQREDARRAAEREAAGAMLELPESAIVVPEPEEVVPGGYWSTARIAVNEMLFGSGEIQAGGSQRTLDLIGAFGLASDVNVLQIGAGLGGAARAIALKYQGWVTGYEADPALAHAAMDPARVNMEVISSDGAAKKSKVKVKFADKARVSHADIENLAVKPNVYDCAFAREVLHTLADKGTLMASVAKGLKPGAPFMITDYFVVKGANNKPELGRWIEQERPPLHPWTLEDAEVLLTGSGFDVRVIEDITAQHRSDIVRDFARFISAVDRAHIAPRLINPLLEFGELWSNRVAAIDAGVIEVRKLVALRVEK